MEVINVSTLGIDLILRGRSGAAYLLESTTNLSLGPWYSLGAIFSSGEGELFYSHQPAEFSEQRFYRAHPIDLENSVLLQAALVDIIDFEQVPGAVITSSLDESQGLSDANGLFALAPTVAGGGEEVTFTITIEAPGYQIYEATQTWADFPAWGTIELTPDP